MDLARTLVRSVVRAFYETKHVLVVDALMTHSTLSNEDLAHLLSMQPKDLRKLCGKLREDRLLAVHSRPEQRDYQQRPANRDYYYIDFHATIDAIKYRVLKLTSRVKEMFKPSEEKKDYRCPRCKAHWTQFEVLDRCGPLGFLCHRCSSVLEREETSTGDAAGSEKQRNLAQQLEHIVQLLRDIDSVTVPPSNFEIALSRQVPIQRNMQINPTRQTVPLEADGRAPVGVKGVNQPVVQDLTIDLTSNAEKTAEEKISEQARKAATAAQNMLPIWHTQSTVQADPITQSLYPLSEALHADAKFEPSLEEGKDGALAGFDESDELAAYYARMAQEKEKEAREDLEDDETSDDEDEQDAFEDVSINPTPSGSQSMLELGGAGRSKLPPVALGGANDGMSESDSSAPASTVTTPAAVIDETESAAKRIKLVTTNGKAVAVSNTAVSDEDEEAEFEDAL